MVDGQFFGDEYDCDFDPGCGGEVVDCIWLFGTMSGLWLLECSKGRGG